MAGQFCNKCMYWAKDIFTRAGENFGECTHTVAITKIIQDTESNVNDEKAVYTEAWFGCIYWREKSLAVIDINKELKRDKDE